jgi:hypothetical protein
MNKVKVFLTSFITCIFTGIILVIIVWASLTPAPLGGNIHPMFYLLPPYDKVAHFMMYAVLAFILCFDWQRVHKWRKVSLRNMIVIGVASAAFGVLMELLQEWMPCIYRRFDLYDILAQISGIIVSLLLYGLLQRRWIEKQ